MVCKECNGEMFIDHVTEKDGVKTIYYACVNPRCRNRGKAFSSKGEESTSMIKNKE